MEGLGKGRLDHSFIELPAVADDEDNVTQPNDACIEDLCVKHELLARRLIRAEKFPNSPIIHRRSRIEEILSIPDVAAALTEDADEATAVIVSRIRAKDQKMSIRPPSPAVLNKQIPESADSTPSQHLIFDFKQAEASRESETAPTSSQQNELLEGSSSSESNRSSASSDSSVSESMVLQRDITNGQCLSLPNAIAPDDAGGDTSLSKMIGDPDDNLESEVMLAKRPPNNFKADRLSLENDEPHMEDYFDTYNRPTLSERRMMQKSRLFSNKSESQTTVLTWRSLERAIARVNRHHSEGKVMDVFPEPQLKPILTARDPGSKPTLRKKTVSFSRLPSEAQIKNAADCVHMMQIGHQFVKMRSNARIYNRFYWFDVSTNCLRWEPSKKDAGKAKIDITSIKEVRSGKATELFLSSDISSHFPEECAFSIIYSDYKNLDLIAGSADEANIWITGLGCLLGGKDPEELQSRRDTRDTWLCSVFESADVNKDGFLDEEESLQLLKSLSDGVRETRIKQKLTEFLRFKDRDRTRLTKDEFVELFKDVTTRPEIYFLLARHSSGDDRLSIDDLMLFLESEQGIIDVTREMCIDLIDHFEPSLELKAIPAIGIDGFTKYLMSPECNIFNPARSQVCQDMSQPLSHYYIASSHNTYLMEDQVSGPSNVGAYIRALLRRCRCVELDCWDGPDGDPIICHGHTQSNSISFEQTMEAIKECSFKQSPYPVILCIENHCSVEQQKIMASILKVTLGDQLYNAPPEEDSEYLPSPEFLKYKFLIKGKKLHPSKDDEGEVTDEDEGAEILSKSPTSPTDYFPILSGNPGPKKETRKLAKELSDLVSLCISVRMTDIDSLSSHGKSRRYCEMTSVHERKAAHLASSCPEEFVNFNKKYLTRVHPSATRTDSSNFNPQDYWNCGVQIVSLNYQTPGLMMDINDGRFAMNGACGYVLKPSIMRDEVAYFSAQHNDVIPSIAPKILHLRIVSGQEFPKPRGGAAKGHIIDPYVLIELFGMPADCSEKRTRALHDCGSGNSTALFDESFEFRLTVPSLALVRFVVLDDEFIGDEFIGQYTIPFECLRPGYRHLRLRSIFDEPLDNATLFVHITVADGNLQLSHAASTPLMSNLTSGVGSNPQPATVPPANSFKLPNKRLSSSALLKKNKKAQQQQQARRERATAMRLMGVKKIDKTFQTASMPLRDAAEMKESLHHSLIFFKEVCGVSSLRSVKQCIRNLVQRLKVESQQGLGRKVARKASIDASYSASPVNGVSSQSTPKLKEKSSLPKSSSNKESAENLNLKIDPSGKLSLRMVIRDNDYPCLEIYNLATQPPSSIDVWKKVLAGFLSLVSDAHHIIDNATKCEESLALIHQEALKYHEELPKLLNDNATDDLTQVNSNPSGKKQKKKSQKEKITKRTQTGLNLTSNAEWDFAWNCSVVRGHIDMLKSAKKEAELLLLHLKEAGIASGLVWEEDVNKTSSSSNLLKKSDSKLSNYSDASKDSNAVSIGGDDLSTGSDSSSQRGKPEDKCSISSSSVTESSTATSNTNNNSSSLPERKDLRQNSDPNQLQPESSDHVQAFSISVGGQSFNNGDQQPANCCAFDGMNESKASENLFQNNDALLDEIKGKNALLPDDISTHSTIL